MLSDHAAIPVLAVADLDRARAFYEGTLGFTSIGGVPEGGIIYGTSNGGFLVYPSAYAGSNKATGMGFQLTTDDFDAEVAALRAAGVELQTFDVPGDAVWTDGVLSDGAMRAAWFADPDGNILNVEAHTDGAG